MKNNLLLTVFVCALAIFCFTTPGLLIGLDNLSPYWGYLPIQNITRITHDYFNVGPLQFLWWLYLLSFFKMPVAIIAKGWIPFYFSLGIFGYYRNWSLFAKSKPTILTQLAIIFTALTSLITVWLISAPSLIYLGLFAISPYLLYYFIAERPKPSLKQSIFIALVLIPILLSSTVNLVAFGFTVLSSALIAAFLYSIPIKQMLSRMILLLGIITAVLQIGLLSFNIKSFVLTHAYHHLINVQQHPFTNEVTAASVRVEKETSSISNALRFSLGWQNIIFPNKESVFPFSWIRTNAFYVAASTLWVVGVIFVTIKWSPNTFQKKLLLLWFSNSLVLSSIGILIVQSIPIIKDMLRMGSTKLWLLSFFPYLILTTKVIESILTSKKFILQVSLTIFGAALIIPLTLSGIFPNTLKTSIPQDYFELNDVIKPTESLYIYPEPQMLYFRKYNWGYYGSDFLGFILDSPTIYDATSLGFGYKQYSDLKKQLNQCNVSRSYTKSFVLIDKTVTSEANISLCDAVVKKLSETEHYDLYVVK